MHNIDIILLYMLFLLTECVCVSSSAVLRINGNFKVDSKRRIRDCITIYNGRYLQMTCAKDCWSNCTT